MNLVSSACKACGPSNSCMGTPVLKAQRKHFACSLVIQPDIFCRASCRMYVYLEIGIYPKSLLRVPVEKWFFYPISAWRNLAERRQPVLG